MNGIVTGVTMERAVDNAHYDALVAMGVKNSRMINCLNDVERFSDGSFGYKDRLYNPLNWCRGKGFAPHIIIGQPPRWIDIPKPEYDLLGNITKYSRELFDWDSWALYVTDVLTEVHIRKGFKTVRWEVGNEMMHGKHANWLNSEGKDLTGSGNAWSDEVYNSYFKLYAVTARAVAAFEAEHPELNIKLGGWASAAHYSIMKFAVHCRNANLKLDFFGLHIYTKGVNLGGVIDTVRKLKEQYNTTKIIITEFGYDEHGSEFDKNDKATKCESVKMFLKLARRWGIDEVYALVVKAHAHNNQESIWETDGITLTPQGISMMEKSL